MQPPETLPKISAQSIGPQVAARLGGITIAIREEPEQPTIIEIPGSLPDQTALLGVLNQLYLHVVPLLSMECLSR